MTINPWIAVMLFTWTYSNPCWCNPLVLEISFFRPDAEVMLWAIKMFLHRFNLDWTILKKDSFGVFIHVSYTRFFSYVLSGTYWKQKIRMNPGVVFPSFIKRHQNHQQSAGLQGFHWLQHFTDQKKQTPTDRPREKSPFRQVLFFGSAEQNVCQFLMMIYEIGQGRPLILKKHSIC